MSRIPRISGQECIKALKKVGFYQKRRESSHGILQRDDPFSQVVVPDHQALAIGTLRAIIRDADLSVKECFSIVPLDGCGETGLRLLAQPLEPSGDSDNVLEIDRAPGYPYRQTIPALGENNG